MVLLAHSQCESWQMCVCGFEDVQVLQVQMPQKLQEEAKPKKDQVDQSIQEVCGQRADGGERPESCLPTCQFYFNSWNQFNDGACVWQDNSLEFEKRRNVPVKYNRELWSKTGESDCGNVALMKLKRSVLNPNHVFVLNSGGDEEGRIHQKQTSGPVYHQQVSRTYFYICIYLCFL